MINTASDNTRLTNSDDSQSSVGTNTSTGFNVDSLFTGKNDTHSYDTDKWSTPDTATTNTSTYAKTNTYESPTASEFTETPKPYTSSATTHSTEDTDKLSAMYDSLTTKSASPVLNTDSSVPPSALPPKKGNSGRKTGRLIAGALAVLLLVVGSSAGFYLVRQSQELRQQASSGENLSPECIPSISVSNGGFCRNDSYAQVTISANRAQGQGCPRVETPYEYFKKECAYSNSCNTDCAGGPVGTVLVLEENQQSVSRTVECDLSGKCKNCQVDIIYNGQNHGDLIKWCEEEPEPSPSTPPLPSLPPPASIPPWPTPSPTPAAFSCESLDFSPVGGTLAPGQSKTFISRSNRVTIRDAWVAVYRPGGAPFCVIDENSDGDDACGQAGIAHLTYPLQVVQAPQPNAGREARATLTYDQLRRRGADGNFPTALSYTAYFVSTDGVYAGNNPSGACIEPLTFVTPSPTPSPSPNIPPARCATNGKRAFTLQNGIIEPNTVLNRGTEFRYRIFVDSNNRQYDVNDTVPAQLEVLALDPVTPGCSINGNAVFCDNITAPVVSLLVRVRTNAQSGTFTNTARITDQGTGSGNGTLSYCSIPLAVPAVPVSPSPTPRVSPSPTPRVSPTPVSSIPPSNPPGPMCISIRMNPSTPPRVNDSVNFTCGPVTAPQGMVLTYEFQYRINGLNWIPILPSTRTSNISQNITIQSGTYDVQCRLCLESGTNAIKSCQPWETPAGPPR